MNYEIEIKFTDKESGDSHEVRGNLGQIVWMLDGWVDTRSAGEQYVIDEITLCKDVHGSD